MAEYRAAVDFGTSYTVAATAADGGQPEVVTLVEEGRLSSAVVLDEAGVLRAGPVVDDVAMLFPDRVERAPKRCLDQPDVMLGRRPVETVDLVATVLAFVTEELQRQFNRADPAEVWLTHPARWEVGDQRIGRLQEAAAAAGMYPVRLLAEPSAAALALAAAGHLDGVADGDLIAVYDLGGGTFDIALLNCTAGGTFALVGEPGGDPSLGGEWLDDRLYERLASQLPGDDEAWLRDPAAAPDEVRWRRAGYAFRREIRRAKERLAREPVVQIPLAAPFALDRLTLSRAELDLTATPLINETADRFELCLQRNGRSPDDLAAICLVGGSSRLSIVNRVLGSRFQRPIATHGDPKSVTALGALVAAARSRTSAAGATGTGSAPTTARTGDTAGVGGTVAAGRMPPELASVLQPGAEPQIAFSRAAELQAAGEFYAARLAYQQVIDSRHPSWAPLAANNLGVMLYEQQDYAGARAAYQIAIDSGDETQASRALMNMSVLLREHRDVGPDQGVRPDHATDIKAD